MYWLASLPERLWRWRHRGHEISSLGVQASGDGLVCRTDGATW